MTDKLVKLSEVLARLEQGFGTNSAPVTTLRRHFGGAELNHGCVEKVCEDCQEQENPNA